MEDGSMRMRSMTKLIGMLAAGFAMSACGRTIEWKQEVPLHDGRVIVIERESEQGGYDPFVGMRMETAQTLSFVHPATGERVRWKLPTGLLPHMLDFDKATPYYVLIAHTVADYNKWGCPNPPYMVFRYTGKDWERISFEQLPTPFVTPNLISMAKSYDEFIIGGFATVESLARYQKKVSRQYRTINREKVNPIAKGCEESVLIKQGRQSEIDTRR
jgi:hypothetical protein